MEIETVGTISYFSSCGPDLIMICTPSGHRLVQQIHRRLLHCSGRLSMPELPEVERARRELASIAEGRRIHSVQTWDDNIVFSQIHHLEWAEMITGKVVVSCKRRGKNFYLVLKDSLHHPIFHLGMSGSTRVRGEEGASYHRVRTPVSPVVFPPKYVKCTITFVDPVTAQETGQSSRPTYDAVL